MWFSQGGELEFAGIVMLHFVDLLNFKMVATVVFHQVLMFVFFYNRLFSQILFLH